MDRNFDSLFRIRRRGEGELYQELLFNLSVRRIVSATTSSHSRLSHPIVPRPHCRR